MGDVFFINKRFQNMENTNEWLSASLRVTVFLKSDEDIEKIPNWESVVQQPPEKSEAQPRIKILHQYGILNKGLLSFTLAPNRVDWRYIGFHKGDQVIENFLTIGPFDESCSYFISMISDWCNHFEALKRIAFGAELIMPRDNHELAYLTLNKFLPEINIDPKSHDFYYRINRKRNSYILNNFKINRLTKWHAVKNTVQIDDFISEPVYGCSLELDINTVPQEGLLIKKNNVKAILDELVGLGKEIAEKGDIP